MRKFKMLILTDHTGHSKENALYALAHAMRHHPRCAQIDVATRSNPLNDLFFKKLLNKQLYVSKVDESFAFHPQGLSFKKQLRREFLRSYDVVWLRLPPPLSEDFLGFLILEYRGQFFINKPTGIYETGSKEFLTTFPDVCPPLKVCRSIEDIIDFKQQFPIVLKPFREYGGKGIVRIEGNTVWEGDTLLNFDDFANKLSGQKIAYLAVKFLKNVTKGDKRIVVVNGKVMGASLRLPAENSWICNVAMGGSSHYAEADEDEIQIVKRINPILSRLGIVMYGVDTLVDDSGKRILSEINTTSIGGLPQIAKLTGKPVLKQAAILIWSYIIENILEKDVSEF